MKRIFLLAFLTLSTIASTLVLADKLTLKSGHPDSYIVKKGDTLWDISAFFLDDPWRWPKLWGANPQIANPHLIYPGDRLTLVFIDGQPRLVLKQHIKKGPEGRISDKGGPIPAIDLSLIQPYLVQNRIVDPEWLDGLPMILAGESPSRHHTVGDVVYINANLPVGEKLAVYQEGREFFDKENSELLGQEIILTASGRVIESGDISKVQLLSNLRESKAGFKVAPVEDEALMSAYFIPKAAPESVPANVLAIEKDIREVGKLDIVYLDKGAVDGIDTGHVFGIYRNGETIVINSDGMPVSTIDRSAYDNLKAKISDDNAITMPDIFHGKLMVFKVFEKTSMAIIIANERPVRVDDKLVTPKTTELKGE
ncbi:MULTISPECIES: LysM peptidoglycan-binding domain-containing protein [unclassified Shewanella]|uniref:LysM peptidoglycan-binding domain-containing protein n=1 Tax=unclassified Shewanella TaxID=196818 RepID=UPI000CC1B854|nr:MULTISPECIES: LysM peptidoglycan-binding domain-containing protein [unclassified Shewanella]MDO6619110.1 LysM peptidoglycan-binding domain-containing protein [Shewanella sp. 6_MG-2023]MDO6640940.1 LysM peptidoglycan-binding domain-containing protein [Shewanella sp. 5_MG-2023]MDO6678987.1 LysM peptidoglycan-binding domain-containing protein [Shewanella sp. 4_MG-2023]MDO6776066.1 LysM peptidoglycan-binding domain-containing protein [Shewanella sp. 3_MG-2023]PMG30894.1 peptidoglycan-binding pr